MASAAKIADGELNVAFVKIATSLLASSDIRDANDDNSDAVRLRRWALSTLNKHSTVGTEIPDVKGFPIQVSPWVQSK